MKSLNIRPSEGPAILIPALSLFVALMSCDGQGVPYLPSDTGPVDTVAVDGVGEDTLRGVDSGPGWDWWDGELLLWRAEQIPLEEVFHDIHGVVNGDGYVVYAVGFRGAALRFDSLVGDWIDISPATTRSVEGVWAGASKLARICGEQGLLMRYEAKDGATYPEWVDETDLLLAAENLTAIHGSAPDNVWAVGERGVVLHDDGTGWRRIPLEEMGISTEDPNDLYDVYTTAPDHVWVAGQGVLFSWNGAEWVHSSVGKASGFLSASGNGDHIWIGSDAGFLYYFNGEAWSKTAAPVYYDYGAVWVDEDGTAYATGEDPSPQSIIWIGKKEPWGQLEVVSPEGIADQWAATDNSLITGLWGRGPEDLFACTQQQQILHYHKHK